MKNVTTNILIDHREEVCADMLIQTPEQALKAQIGYLQAKETIARQKSEDNPQDDMAHYWAGYFDLALDNHIAALNYWRGIRRWTIAYMVCDDERYSTIKLYNDILQVFGLIPPCSPNFDDYRQQYNDQQKRLGLPINWSSKG